MNFPEIYSATGMMELADAADSLASLFQHNRPCRFIMKECPDNLPTFFYGLMRWPSRTWSHIRVGGVLEERLCIRFLPVAE